jgi:hypothetical protein
MKQTRIRISNRLALMAAALVIVSATAAAQDFTIRMKAEDGTISTTYYVSRNAILKTSALLDVIFRIDRGTIIYVTHNKKTYGEMSVAEMRQAIAKGMPSDMASTDPRKQEAIHRMGLDAPPQVTKLGPGENIAGYPTEKYSVKTPMAQAEVWITQALQFPSPYYKEFNVLAGQAGPLSHWEAETMKIQGVILKRAVTVTFMNMSRATKPTMTEVAASVDKGAIPASTFEPPAGYSKVSK